MIPIIVPTHTTTTEYVPNIGCTEYQVNLGGGTFKCMTTIEYQEYRQSIPKIEGLEALGIFTLVLTGSIAFAALLVKVAESI